MNQLNKRPLKLFHVTHKQSMIWSFLNHPWYFHGNPWSTLEHHANMCNVYNFSMVLPLYFLVKGELTVAFVSISHALFTEITHYLRLLSLIGLFIFLSICAIEKLLCIPQAIRTVCYDNCETHTYTLVVHLADPTYPVLQSLTVGGWRVEEDL